MISRFINAPDLIQDRVAYIDTVVFWANWNLPKSQLDLIRQHCSGAVWPEYSPMKYHPNLKCKITMQRPNEAVFKILEDWIYRRNIILMSQVSFALDFTTNTEVEAMIVWDFFAKHAVKLWPGKNDMGSYKQTIYSSQNKHQSNSIVQYASRGSKIIGSPCHHFEWRCQGAGAARRVGIFSPIDLLDFDHNKFWKKRLVLEEINKLLTPVRRKRGRPKVKISKSSKRYSARRPNSRALLLARGLAYNHHNEEHGFIRPSGAAQVLKKYLRPMLTNYRLRKCFRRIDNTPYLPE